MSRREEILEKVKAVVSLPPAASKVIQLVQGDDVNISELTKTIEYDPGLTSNILRLANSAELGGMKEIGSIRNAIVRMGMKRLFRLVMLSTVSPMARKPVRGYDLPAGELWEHSIAVAIGVGKLAEILNTPAPDYLFTAGLLHDIGKILLGTFVEVDAEPILELSNEENIPFDVAEEKVLGINHAEVGAALLDKWGLPIDIVNVTRWHHETENFPGESMIVDLVHIADGISITFGIGVRKDGLNYYLSQELLTRLNLKGTALETLAMQTMDSLEEVRNLFNIK